MTPSSLIPVGPLAIPFLPRGPEFVWPVPGSKIISNRALVLAALAEGTSTLEGVLNSDDTDSVRGALEAVGVAVRATGSATLQIEGGLRRLRRPDGAIYVGNSSSAARFMMALACLVEGPVTLTGSPRVTAQSIADLVGPLRQLGVRVDCPTGCLPVTIWGQGTLPGGLITINGARSSQFLSAVLLVAPLAAGDLDIRCSGRLVGRAYVDLTCKLVRAFGAEIGVTPHSWLVRGASKYSARTYRVEPDACSANCAFALAAGGKGAITVPGLADEPLQSDATFLELLTRAGVEVQQNLASMTVRTATELRGLDADMRHLGDTFVTLAALAAAATGASVLWNAGDLRAKDPDRILATASELSRLGQGVRVGDDWLEVDPRPIRPAVVHTYGDHQMAMGFAVLGALRGGVTIDDPGCVTKSYPGFWRDFAACYEAAGAPAPW